MSRQRFAIDLITLYHPRFWDVDNFAALIDRSESDPRGVWDRLLATVSETGATGVEVTFPPGDLDTAARGYGSLDGLLDALREHNLQIVSGYFAGLDLLKTPLEAASQQETIAAASQFARRLREAGGEIVVSGLPALDPSVSRGAHTFVDLAYLQQIADLINRVGAAVRDQDLYYAMHPEFGSLFCRRREIDLLLLLTDPDLVGFCPDTAHITLAGGDPIAITEQHRDRVLLTHWKDAAGRFEGELPDGDKRFEAIAPRFLPIGEGTVDWDGWRRMLERIDYRGWIVLELDDSPDPVEQISRARRFVEEALV